MASKLVIWMAQRIYPPYVFAHYPRQLTMSPTVTILWVDCNSLETRNMTSLLTKGFSGKSLQLPLLAGLLQGCGYIIYIYMMHGGNSTPNIVSWTLWVILTMLQAWTYWRASRSAIAAIPFFTGTFFCFCVWVYAVFSEKFTPIETMDWVILLLCFIVIIVWHITNKATYANVLLGFITIVSFVPTLQDVSLITAREHFLPWTIWALVYVFVLIHIVQRRFKEHEDKRWWLLLFAPTIDMFVHSTIAVVAFL